MGVNRTADNTPLLMDAEQNIGNSAIIRPQAGSYPSGTVIPQTNPERILNLAAGGSASGQTMTVAMSATRILKGEQNPYPGLPGPITGIVEFGNGGRFTQVEFDVPVGPFAGLFESASRAVEPQDGVVEITVPAGAMRVYARYDNLLVAPLLGTDPPLSQAQWTTANGVAVPFIGPGGPLLIQNPLPPPAPANVIINPEPVLVKAMATYFGRAPTHSRVYKTLNLYLSPETLVGPPPVPPDILIGTPPVRTIAGFGNFNFWALPAYTKRVKLLRFPNSANLAVLLHDGIRPVDFFTTGVGGSFPEFDVDGGEIIIGISSQNDAGNAVHMLKLICEVGI